MANGGEARPGAQAKRYDPEGAKATDATRVCGAEKREGMTGGGREQSSLAHKMAAALLGDPPSPPSPTLEESSFYALSYVTTNGRV